MTTPPTPPRDLSEHDRAGIAGTIHPVDPAAVERLRALMARQQPTPQAEAIRRQYSGDRIAANIQRAAEAVNARRRVVLSDEQYADVTARRANGETWAGIARALGLVHTTLMLAYARQTHAGRQTGKQQEQS